MHDHESRLKIVDATDSVRALAAYAIEQNDEQMLPALRDIGVVAERLASLQEIFSSSVVMDLSDEAVQVQESQAQNGNQELVDGDKVSSGSAAMPEKTEEQPQGTEASDKAIDSSDSHQQFSDIQLNELERALFSYLLQHEGQKVAPKELVEQISAGSQSTRRSAVTRFIKKLKHSPYGANLTSEGATTSTRYTWSPNVGDSNSRVANQTNDNGTVAAQTAVTPSPISMPIRQVEHAAQPPAYDYDEASQTANASMVEAVEDQQTEKSGETNDDSSANNDRLHTLGVELHQNGDRYLTVKKVDLKLEGFDIDVFLKIAQSDKGAYYHELLQELDVPGEENVDRLRSLNGALSNIGVAMEEHGITWKVEEPTEYDKKTRRPRKRKYFEIGGTPAQSLV